MELKKNNKQIKNLKFYEAVGRRKSAVARVRLYLVGKEKTANVNGVKIKAGEIFVNGKKVDEYFSSPVDKVSYLLPLEKTGNEKRFAISVLIKGGGKKGQLEAFIHGLAKALVLVDNSYRKILRELNLLTRDAREKQRRMVGTGGKARRKKQSPKR